MRGPDAREAKWVSCDAPKPALNLWFTELASNGRKHRFGMPTEFVRVLLASNGKLYRVVTTVPEWETTQWEGYEG